MSLWYTTVPTTVPRDATRANAFARTKFAPVKRVSDGNRAFCACGRAGTPPFKFRTSSGRFLYRERRTRRPVRCRGGYGSDGRKSVPVLVGRSSDRNCTSGPASKITDRVEWESDGRNAAYRKKPVDAQNSPNKNVFFFLVRPPAITNATFYRIRNIIIIRSVVAVRKKKEEKKTRSATVAAAGVDGTRYIAPSFRDRKHNDRTFAFDKTIPIDISNVTFAYKRLSRKSDVFKMSIQ